MSKLIIARHYDVKKTDQQGNRIFADSLELVTQLGKQRKEAFVSEMAKKGFTFDLGIASPQIRAYESLAISKQDLHIARLLIAPDYDDWWSPIDYTGQTPPEARFLLLNEDFIYSNFAPMIIDEDNQTMFYHLDQDQKKYWLKIAPDLQDPIKLLESQDLVSLMEKRLAMVRIAQDSLSFGQSFQSIFGRLVLPRTTLEEIYPYQDMVYQIENVEKVRNIWEHIVTTYPEKSILCFVSERTGIVLDEIVQGHPVPYIETLLHKTQLRMGECIIFDRDSEGKVISESREMFYPEVTTGKEMEQPSNNSERNISRGIEG